MQKFSTSPKTIIVSLWLNRGLLRGLIHREIIGRYKGSFLGILWSFFNPLLMLAVYTFFFSVVFRARWAGGSGSKAEFALVLFSGLLVFNFFSECINRAPSLVLSNVNYVKKVIFPLELLPVVAMGGAGFHLFISFLVWLGFYVIVFGIPHAGVLLLPVVLLPLALLTLGFSWCLAALGVYLRDVSQVVVTLVPMLMFLSPIFYPISILPAELQSVVRLSPVTIAVEQAREVMYWGTSINWLHWGGYLTVASVIAWLGFAWFQKTRKGFADVI
ncbi:MAG: ABC transporter permease [Azoarcus sp.]|jgi:lipopolysaccharide transport system permease protein|nr:ABC transporter permease [Azoarcus sp.]